MLKDAFLTDFYKIIDLFSAAIEEENFSYRTRASNVDKKKYEQRKIEASESYTTFCSQFQKERVFEVLTDLEKQTLLERIKSLETLLLENKLYIDARAHVNERYKKIIIDAIQKVQKPITFYNALGKKQDPSAVTSPVSFNQRF